MACALRNLRLPGWSSGLWCPIFMPPQLNYTCNEYCNESAIQPVSQVRVSKDAVWHLGFRVTKCASSHIPMLCCKSCNFDNETYFDVCQLRLHIGEACELLVACAQGSSLQRLACKQRWKRSTRRSSSTSMSALPVWTHGILCSSCVCVKSFSWLVSFRRNCWTQNVPIIGTGIRWHSHLALDLRNCDLHSVC